MGKTNSLKSYTIDIDGMTCEHCTNTVSAALRAVGGVRTVRVDMAPGCARVDVDGDRAGIAPLLNAVRTAGFAVRRFRETSDPAADA
ncbi:MAG: heavy-metal-associated domain-containing protein [Phycisphaerae bacterium]